jgi:hypothetical protein
VSSKSNTQTREDCIIDWLFGFDKRAHAFVGQHFEQ